MPLISHMTNDGRQVTISIIGQFNFSVYHDFRAAYKQAPHDDTAFEINLQGTEYMDSSALGMLLVLRERAGGDNANVRITNCNPEIRKIFSIANFDRLFHIS